ncbi:MAG: hypothetical protein J1E83_03145 [Lachnospiraceae bacterium]|nr:hypothetical protein [Lachnospiraceae bacterium]
MKDIKKTWDFCLRNLYFELCVTGGAGILGIGVTLFFSRVLGKDSFESFGLNLTLIFWVISVFFMGAVEAATVFYFMISMGKPRKAFLVSYGTVQVLHQLFGLVLIFVIALLEWILAAAAGLSPVWEVTGWSLFTDIGTLVLFVFGFPVLILFFGVLYIKFKDWVFIGLCLLAMGGNFIGRYIIAMGESGSLKWLIKVFDHFLRLAPIWHTLFACAGFLLLLGLSWMMVRKQTNI